MTTATCSSSALEVEDDDFESCIDEFEYIEGFQIDFDRTTFGVQYFFNPRVRVALNYEMRNAEAPNFPSGAGPNGQVDGIDDRIGIQVTAIWSQ